MRKDLETPHCWVFTWAFRKVTEEQQSPLRRQGSPVKKQHNSGGASAVEKCVNELSCSIRRTFKREK